jgi:hypothetical protein
MDTICSQCNARMSCDPGHECWCSELPHALPVPNPGTTGCLAQHDECREASKDRSSAEEEMGEG